MSRRKKAISHLYGRIEFYKKQNGIIRLKALNDVSIITAVYYEYERVRNDELIKELRQVKDILLS